MWKFTNIPKWHPQIFRKKIGPKYGDMFDRRFLLSRNPFEDIQTSDDKSPVANLIAQENSYIIEIPVPGFKKEDISVEIVNDHLIVKGSKDANDLNEANYILLEHSYEEFERSFLLSSITDQDRIEAKVEDGVLYITLHHKEGAKLKGRKSQEEMPN